MLGEFDASFFTARAGSRTHRSLSRFPALYQDLALICSEETPAAAIEKTLRKAAGPLLAGLRLFDVYRGEQIGAGRKSLAYNLVFQAPDRSLTEGEINRLREKILRKLKKDLDVDLRS